MQFCFVSQTVCFGTAQTVLRVKDRPTKIYKLRLIATLMREFLRAVA